MAIRIFIDEQEVKAEPGESVLMVARREGFDIPALCYHEAVESIGACRLCLVEVRAGARPGISTSCNMKAEDGLRISTDSPEIRRDRATNLELLLLRAPGSPVLRELAARWGVRPRLQPPPDAGIANCILCELCVRVCAALGHNALAAVGRGEKKRVGPAFGKPAEGCVGCGACLSVCPTRCIVMKDTPATRTIWGQSFEFHHCQVCGQPVITEKHRAFAIAKRGLPEDYYDVCEPCKQSQASQRFAGVVW